MRVLTLCGWAILALACSDADPGSAPRAGDAAPQQPQEMISEQDPAEAAQLALKQQGKRVYQSNCIACHNLDPHLDGAVGPANAGASRELIESRVLRAEYPPGYQPKRSSRVMPALPHLAGEIDALAAYLADPGQL